MQHPKIFAEVHCVDHSKGIPSKGQRNFVDTRAQPTHGFRNVRLPALCRDRQGRQTNLPGFFSKSFRAARNQEMGRVFRIIPNPPFPFFSVVYVVIYDYTCQVLP